MNTIGYTADRGFAHDTSSSLPGLKGAGTTIGLITNVVGSGSDPLVDQWLGDGFTITRGVCTPAPVGGVNRVTNGLWDETYISSAAAEVAAAHLDIPFCYVVLDSAEGGGFLDGSIICTTTTDPAVVTHEEFSMAGFGRCDLGVGTVTRGDSYIAPPSPPPPPLGTGELSVAFNPVVILLRPSPLSWPGQDPDNLANRVLWRTSEVAAITYRIAGSGSRVIYQISYGLYGMTYTDYPAYCTIPTPFSEPVQPGEIQIGDAVQGLRPRGWRRTR